jgi:hypothetical protein
MPPTSGAEKATFRQLRSRLREQAGVKDHEAAKSYSRMKPRMVAIRAWAFAEKTFCQRSITT